MAGLWACSGPGAPKAIGENIELAQHHAWVVAGTLAASAALYFVLPRARVFPLVCLGLLALHPSWTISAWMGDCGYLKVGVAKVFTLVALLVVVSQVPFGFRAWAQSRSRA